MTERFQPVWYRHRRAVLDTRTLRVYWADTLAPVRFYPEEVAR